MPAAAATAWEEAAGNAKLSRFARSVEPLRMEDLDRTLGAELPQLVKSAAVKASAERERDRWIMQWLWGVGLSLGVLLAATAGVAVLSEWLVGAIEHAGPQLGMTEIFMGVIVVAIVGNAAEHSTAILVAYRNRMDLSLQIAVGSTGCRSAGK